MKITTRSKKIEKIVCLKKKRVRRVTRKQLVGLVHVSTLKGGEGDGGGRVGSTLSCQTRIEMKVENGGIEN